MEKNKRVKSELLASALSLLLCIAMLAGSTFAWFTDSVTSKGNVIQSGTIKAKLEYSKLVDGQWTAYAEVNEQTDIFGYDKWEPGYAAVVKFRITNMGTLAMKYRLAADIQEETPGINTAGEEFLLSDCLYAQVVDADATREEILTSADGSRLKDTADGDIVIQSLPLEVGETAELAVAVWMPATLGTDANHNGTAPSISFDIKLVATQQGAESFG